MHLRAVSYNLPTDTATVELAERRGGEAEFVVGVVFNRNAEADPVAVGITVTRTPGGVGAPRPLSPRDVQRLPLTRIRDAMLEVARNPTTLIDEFARLQVPKGRPERGKSTAFYKEIADTYRTCKLKGLSPAKEIAKIKRVDENRVYTWIHRARKLGLLEKPGARSG